MGVNSASSGRVRFTIMCSVYKNRSDPPRGLDAPKRNCILIGPLDPRDNLARDARREDRPRGLVVLRVCKLGACRLRAERIHSRRQRDPAERDGIGRSSIRHGGSGDRIGNPETDVIACNRVSGLAVEAEERRTARAAGLDGCKRNECLEHFFGNARSLKASQGACPS